jgi:hypothetical protein
VGGSSSFRPNGSSNVDAMANKQALREARGILYGHPLLIQRLLSGLEVFVCEETGSVIIGLGFTNGTMITTNEENEEGFQTYRDAEGHPKCDPIYDRHLPITQVKSLVALRKAKAILDQAMAPSA